MWSDNAPNFALNVCRLCANISEVVVPIFGKDGEKERIDLKIKKCLPIAVREEDYKPKQVCFTCASKLEVCVDLVDLCLASEFKFESVLHTRYPGLKTLGTVQPQMQGDEEGSKETSLGVVKAEQHSSVGSTLTVQHDGGVIVLSKVDSESQNRGDECQDILLMVELKYKDVPEPQHAKGHAITYEPYTVEPQAKTYTLAYSTEPQVISATKSHTITYTTETQPITVSKAQTYTYTTEQQPNTLSGKTHTLMYAADPHSVPVSKTHTLVYTTEAQSVPLTKTQALIKSNVLSFTPEQDTGMSNKPEDLEYTPELEQEVMDKTEDMLPVKAAKMLAFPTEVETESTVVLDTNMTHQATLLLNTEKYKEDGIEENGTAPRPEKPFPCTVCGKSFMRRTNLNVHMAVHTQIRPHACDQCGKRFVLRWDLTLHQRIHAGLFQCEFCSKAFSVRGKLERHRRTHTGERPFACATCGKAFGDKRNLESHQRTHSGERPFACTTCGRSFRVRSHLSDHRRVHSQDYFPKMQ